MRTIGVIGLGNMGAGMASTLARGGFTVHGYDPDPNARVRLAQTGIDIAPTIAAVAGAVQAVILSLPTSAVVEQAVFGPDGILSGARPGLVVIDTTTAHPDSTRKVAQALRDAGLLFIDAPVSGGAQGAAQGTLTMMLGGESDTIDKAKAVLECLSAKRVHVGPAGAGHTAKLLNNLLCGAHLLLAGEAARMARAAGLDPERIFDGINAGSGRSAATEVNYPRWIFSDAYDSGFTMKLMRKDIGLAINLLEGQDATPAPMARLAGELWRDSAANIGDTEDFNRIVDFHRDSD